jgi:hypothetical protein
MIFKMLGIIMLSAALMFGGGVKATAAEEDVTTGVFSSHKELLEVQWVEYDGDRVEFVMIQDDIRVAERVKNEGTPSLLIMGIHNGVGFYRVYAQTPFGSFPLGIMHWEQILMFQPSWRLLRDFQPTMFQTADGFEDVWAYFEFSDEDIEGIKSLIRKLNMEDLKKYERDM